MAKNTSILLGKHYEAFIQSQIESGKFATVSEVIRAALRLFEFEQEKSQALIQALKEGEESELIHDFDRHEFLKGLQSTSRES